jgi:hypothetical protein
MHSSLKSIIQKCGELGNDVFIGERGDSKAKQVPFREIRFTGLA